MRLLVVLFKGETYWCIVIIRPWSHSQLRKVLTHLGPIPGQDDKRKSSSNEEGPLESS